MTNKKKERLIAMVSILSEQVGASIRMLSQQLGVSEITVRRDIETLAEQGAVKLINGTVIYTPQNEAAVADEEYNIDLARVAYGEQKKRIGRLAASMVEPHDVIAIDVGTTAEYLAAHLPSDYPLTVVCYSFNPVMSLKDRPNCQIIFAGGYYTHNTQMFQSPEGLALIRRTSINKAFLSATGIDSKWNVTCVDPFEIQIKRTVMEASLNHILLADSSKFGRICPGTFAQLSDFSTVITDEAIDEQWRSTIANLDIRLLTAPAGMP